MFSNDNIIIKNEPIESEDTEFVNEDVKSDFENFVNVNSSTKTKTTICTESEYLADGNHAYESIFVKEEKRLNSTYATKQQIHFHPIPMVRTLLQNQMVERNRYTKAIKKRLSATYANLLLIMLVNYGNTPTRTSVKNHVISPFLVMYVSEHLH